MVPKAQRHNIIRRKRTEKLRWAWTLLNPVQTERVEEDEEENDDDDEKERKREERKEGRKEAEGREETSKQAVLY